MRIRHYFLIFNAIIFLNNLNGQPQKLYTFDKNPQVKIKNSPIDLSGLKLQKKYFSSRDIYWDSINNISIDMIVVPGISGGFCTIRDIKLVAGAERESSEMRSLGYIKVSDYDSSDKLGNYIYTSFYIGSDKSNNTYLSMIRRKVERNKIIYFRIRILNFDLLKLINSNIDVVLK